MTKCLDGKTIIKLRIAEDKMALKFTLKDGSTVKVLTDGDCCSHSWIEHIELPAGGFPCKVLGISDLNYDDIPGEYGDVTAVYGCKISTDKGDLIIDYRNESNGYYGGNLSWPDDSHFYGGVHGQNISEEKWKILQEDI